MQFEFVIDPEVQDWQWRIASTMRRGIENSFGTRPDEVDCVRAIVDAIRGLPSIAGRHSVRGSFRLEVESAFLHGPRSQVRFHIGGNDYQRELADLLVLATYVEDGVLTFQRACFIQAKRSGSPSRHSAARIDIDPWQLALLGSFPEFTGISGEFKGLTYQLRSRSGMLGAYGLLSPPGELTVVSARILNHLLGGRNSLTIKEIIPAILSETGASRSAWFRCEDWWFDPDHCPECFDLALHWFPHRWWRHHRSHPDWHTAGMDSPAESVLTCVGLDEFVQSWSSLRLGEVWHAKSRTTSDLALRACLQGMVSRVTQETGALSGLYHLLAEAGGGDNILERRERGEGEARGLGILSVVANVRRGEG